MKRLLSLFPVMVLALVLAGCAGSQKSVLEGGTSITATIQNPVDAQQEAKLEVSYGLAATAIVNYARLPRCGIGQEFTAAKPCSSWKIVKQMQDGNRIVYKKLTNLRAFMDDNDQVSAIVAFNAARKALNQVQAIAFINGIPIPDAP